MITFTPEDLRDPFRPPSVKEVVEMMASFEGAEFSGNTIITRYPDGYPFKSRVTFREQEGIWSWSRSTVAGRVSISAYESGPYHVLIGWGDTVRYFTAVAGAEGLRKVVVNERLVKKTHDGRGMVNRTFPPECLHYRGEIMFLVEGRLVLKDGSPILDWNPRHFEIAQGDPDEYMNTALERGLTKIDDPENTSNFPAFI